MNDSTDDLWSSDYWGTPERASRNRREYRTAATPSDSGKGADFAPACPESHQRLRPVVAATVTTAVTVTAVTAVTANTTARGATRGGKTGGTPSPEIGEGG